MKKFFALMTVSVLLTSPALAVPAETNFPSFQTVDADQSTTEKNVFNLDETPWAYSKIDAVSANRHAHLQTDWYFGDTLLGQADVDGPTHDDKFWTSPLNWDSIKQPGEWTVKGFFQVHNDADDSVFKTGLDSYNFTVTPEPASLALFGMGSAALGLVRLRRRKKA